MSDPDAPLILVDGSSYVYRAFHALPPLTTASGRPTGAIYGVASMLRKLMSDYRPTHMGVVFDAPGRTFRDDLFDQYKANRPPMPAELAGQLEPLKRLVRALGLPLIEVPGVEADDVIGTLAVQARQAGLPLLVSTGDKDMAQLVNESVTLLNTMSNTVLDVDGVMKKFGVPPERIVDYLALVGDTSDNIPGVPRVGPKTAARWLAEHGSLDGVIGHAGEIGGKVGESLREHLDDLALSRELATIRCDVDLGLAPGEIRLGEPDNDTLAELYRELEFGSWLGELQRADPDAGKAEAERISSSATACSSACARCWRIRSRPRWGRT